MEGHERKTQRGTRQAFQIPRGRPGRLRQGRSGEPIQGLLAEQAALHVEHSDHGSNYLLRSFMTSTREKSLERRQDVQWVGYIGYLWGSL